MEKDIQHRALNPKILYDWVKQSSEALIERDKVIEYLFKCGSPVYLHTYTPEGLSVATGNMNQRERIATLAFPNSKINLVDTRSEFFNNEEFDWPNLSKYDSEYYSYQLGVFFQQIVEKEVLKRFIERKPEGNKVFIVHGRSENEKYQVARLLENQNIEIIILNEQINQGRNIFKKFKDYSDVGFAIVLLTGDDKGGLANSPSTEYMLRARQNVIFELGYFLAKLSEDRVLCLYSNNLEIPSDYSGILYINFDINGAWKYALLRELQGAGFEVDFQKVQ